MLDDIRIPEQTLFSDEPVFERFVNNDELQQHVTDAKYELDDDGR